MKIGIYIPSLEPSTGGGYSFYANILQNLNKYDGDHLFYILYDNCNMAYQDDGKIIYISLNHHDSPRRRGTIIKLFKYLIKILNKLLVFNENLLGKTIFRNYYSAVIKNGIIESELKFFDFSNPLNNAVNRFKIDMVWFITPAALPVEVPYIFTVWDLQHRLQSYFPEVSVTGWKWRDRESHYNHFIPQAAYVIAGTNTGKDEIKYFYRIPENRIKVIPFPAPVLNRSNITQVDIKEKYHIGGDYVFYPAQFWPHKNHIVILMALKLLISKYNIRMHVIFTGADKGNLEYIKKKILSNNLQEYVHILGFVSDEVLINLYKNAFALVFPTFFGPDNIPPLEAFSSKCPVIASNVAGAKEQLGEAAIYFDPENEQQLALAIKRLYSNISLRNKIIKKGKQLSERHTTEKYISDIMSLVDNFSKIRRCWDSDAPYIHT